jgi:predicted RNA polymerase sigma factor
LSRLDRHSEAQAEFELAASLASNAQERTMSAERAAASAALAGLTSN